MNIDFANLQKHYLLYKEEIDTAVHAVMEKCNFIMGEEVIQLEEELANYAGVKHAITCSSGTDALQLSLMAIDIAPGDEVITTPFTFIATAEMIAHLGAIPVFVDIDEATYTIDPTKIEAAITPKTKAIIPVSLYGQCADMDAINAVAEKYHLIVIEDGAQSFGATYKGKKSCGLSEIGCTSFFPAKPLGCFGDGGAVFTDNDRLAEKIRSLRVHGQSKRYHHRYIGIGGRLDTIQAAVLLVKLRHYECDLSMRQTVAHHYDTVLSSKYPIPFIAPEYTSAYAQYSIRVQNRDVVQEKLKSAGIPTAVHYPMPLHLQECFTYLGYRVGDFPVCERVSKEIMSLPMNPFLSNEEIAYISHKVIECLG
ncbi:MAG: DegT/DnrJ/EryC1/StrS family aminotransferase [Sulfuricurvum sp.]|jgi:UDP-2-acetamido-2-deoxy-ribo-hexuluronate aminotransferase|uniref:DegT/DnrJ/EryC1/StrS family aminotransferase n=1 Tax=Sulfuricurvum sp. TaxID=2025608 RepID=UPI0025D6E6DD|nr:DegT/DnrJ/EryC1/StrS family aminotransferase [Sulfuricurvum sp.]MCI4406746.1 DegT/DnrJ/EryC1/StrS family aminotransferase [Sulfuricurvum sp.]